MVLALQKLPELCVKTKKIEQHKYEWGIKLTIISNAIAGSDQQHWKF